MMYNHWKKLLLALTTFFWNACDNSSTSPTFEGSDSSSSATSNSNSSSSSAEIASSSSEVNSSSSEAQSSSSNPVVQSSSSMDVVPQPLYGVFMGDVCTRIEGDSKLTCSDGVTCVESIVDEEQVSIRNRPEVTAKYGVVIVRDKTYTCDDGKVYNEADFLAHYNVFTEVKPDEKIPCERVDDNSFECEDGQSFVISTDDNGNTIYSNGQANLSEDEFFDKYMLLERAIALYGPPCVFNNSCGEEK